MLSRPFIWLMNSLRNMVQLEPSEEYGTKNQEIDVNLGTPMIVHSPRFGDLTLERRSHCFEGSAQWNGITIQISFQADEQLDISKPMATAEQLWDRQDDWQEQGQAFAVEQLLSTKNDYWLNEDEEPLNSTDFKSRMTLESITVLSDGRFEFLFDDGELFAGHYILVSGSVAGGFSDAFFEG